MGISLGRGDGEKEFLDPYPLEGCFGSSTTMQSCGTQSSTLTALDYFPKIVMNPLSFGYLYFITYQY